MFSTLSLLIFFLASIIQLTIMPRISLFGAIPNLVLVLIILWSVFFGFKRTFWLAIIAGLLLDLFSGSYFGIFAISFLMITFIVDLATSYIFSNNYFLSTVTFCSIFTIVLTFLFNWLIFKNIFSDYKLITILFMTIFFNLFIAIVLFPLLDRFKDKIQFHEKKVKLPY